MHDYRRVSSRGFATYHETIDDRLDKEEIKEASRTLRRIIEGPVEGQVLEDSRDSDPDLEKPFTSILIYKNRPLATCRLLHLVVATPKCSHYVSQLLGRRADPKSIATYRTNKGKHVYETQLEPLHIAAGLGNIEALNALFSHVRDFMNESPIEFLGRPAKVRDVEKLGGWVDFYQPLHDATYCGQVKAILWLLDHAADACAQNKDGQTPLHFVALIGGSGTLKSEEDVEKVVKRLLSGKANLAAKSKEVQEEPYPCDSSLLAKVPLEIAAVTQYPKELLHLLAPSNSPEALARPRLLNDVLLLARRNMSVAENFMLQIRERASRPEESKLREAIWTEAQLPGQVDLFANLLYLVPKAAADLLDLLTVDPKVQDDGKYPIPCRTELPDSPMRCTYQKDFATYKGIHWPIWKFNAQDQTKNQEQGWHRRLIPKSDADLRSDRDYDVETKCVLLPNLLDVDLIMALTRTWDNHNQIFARLPVQGLIYCLWDNLVWQVFTSSWVFFLLELVVLIYWGLVAQTEKSELRETCLASMLLDTDGEPTPEMIVNSPSSVPMCQSVLLAGVIRELINLLWWFLAHWSKWVTHERKALKALWDPWLFFQDGWVLSSVLFLVFRMALLVSTWPTATTLAHPMTDSVQALLALNAFLQGFRITYLFRLMHRFKAIIAIFKTFFSRTIREMLLIAVMIFASFGMAFLMMIRSQSSGWTIAYLYRGLMFGDGEGLDNMGLNHKSPPANTGIMVVATLLFNVTIINLIVAVYGNEYDAIRSKTELLFMKERAKYCLIYIEMLHKQRVIDMYQALRHEVLVSNHTVALPVLAWCVVAFLLWFTYKCCLNVTVFFAAALAIGQIWWQASLIQATWFLPDAPNLEPGVAVKFLDPEEREDQYGVLIQRREQDGMAEWLVDLQDEPAGSQHGDLRQHHVESQHGADNSRSRISRMLSRSVSSLSSITEAFTETPRPRRISASIEKRPVWVVENDIRFQEPPGFLWICHRADYDPNYFHEAAQVTYSDLEEVLAKVNICSEAIQESKKTLEALSAATFGSQISANEERGKPAPKHIEDTSGASDCSQGSARSH